MVSERFDLVVFAITSEVLFCKDNGGVFITECFAALVRKCSCDMLGNFGLCAFAFRLKVSLPIRIVRTLLGMYFSGFEGATFCCHKLRDTFVAS